MLSSILLLRLYPPLSLLFLSASANNPTVRRLDSTERGNAHRPNDPNSESRVLRPKRRSTSIVDGPRGERSLCMGWMDGCVLIRILLIHPQRRSGIYSDPRGYVVQSYVYSRNWLEVSLGSCKIGWRCTMEEFCTIYYQRRRELLC